MRDDRAAAGADGGMAGCRAAVCSLSTSGAFQLNRDGAGEARSADGLAAGPRGADREHVELGKALTELDEPPVKAHGGLQLESGGDCAGSGCGAATGCGVRICSRWCWSNSRPIRRTTPIFVLPVTTFLEHTDLYLAYGHYYLQLARPALTAPGETRSNVEIFRALAKRMGFTEPCFDDSEDDMMQLAAALGVAVSARNHAGALESRTFGAAELSPRVSRFCRSRRVRNRVRAIRVRRGDAGLHATGGIAARRCRIGAVPAGIHLAEKRRQHEFNFWASRKGRCANVAFIDSPRRCFGARNFGRRSSASI